MSATPKVAIIVPIYNVEQYLEECLDSVIKQTYKKLEIVLVDDGSTDKSLEIAKRYFEADSRMSLICKSNGGLSSARNAGLEYVCGNLTYQPLLHPIAPPLSQPALQSDTESTSSPTTSSTSSQNQSTYVFKALLKDNAPSNITLGEKHLTGGGGGRVKQI